MKSEPSAGSPPVAVLYATRNDFIDECAQTCINLDYPSYHLFICDDSTVEYIRQAVDQFYRQHLYHCTIIRRNDRSGFKAGNINNALHKIDPKYQYIIVVDHDSVLPSNFVRNSLRYFTHNPRLAFVQAVHHATLSPHNTFSADLSMGVDCLWQYLILKNQFGFVSCFGHGVMIRRDVLSEVGGFPEIVSEDLGLATTLREAGYSGIVANDVVCGEGLPASLNRFRRRYEKWFIGMMEFSKVLLGRFLRSNRPSSVEKIDLVFHCLNLVNIVPLVVFIGIVNIFVPIAYGQSERLTVESNLFQIAAQLDVLSTRSLFTDADSTFLRILVIGAITAPLLYFCKNFLTSPVRTIRHIAISFACFCSLIIPSIITMAIFFFRGVLVYRTTGDFQEDRVWEYGEKSSRWLNFYVGKGYSLLIECVCCTGLLLCALWTANLFLLSFAIGAFVGPVFTFLNWDYRAFSIFKYLPFFLLLWQLIMVGMPMLGYTGIFTNLVVVHF